MQNNDLIKRPVVIVLEGIDASGKTTLLDRLHSLFPGTTSLKNRYRPPVNANRKHLFELLSNYRSMRNRAQESPGKVVIFDRYVPSELVYSKVKRHYSALHEFPSFMELLEVWGSLAEARKVKPLVILWVISPRVENFKRLRGRGDDYTQENELDALFFQYLKVMKLILDHTQVLVVIVESTFSDQEIIDRVARFEDYQLTPEQLESEVMSIWTAKSRLPLKGAKLVEHICDCKNFAEYDEGLKYCSVCGTKLN